MRNTVPALLIASGNTNIPAARQLVDGRWRSELGKYVDIDHDFLLGRLGIVRVGFREYQSVTLSVVHPHSGRC